MGGKLKKYFCEARLNIYPHGSNYCHETLRYRAMNDCVQRWKHYDNGKTWSRISTHKEPVLEPRTAADLKARRGLGFTAALRD